MAEQLTEREKHERRKEAGEVCFDVVLDGLRAFFEGRAVLHIGSLPVRFEKTPEA